MFTVASVYLINIFRLLPFLALIPIVCALILKLALTLIKDEKYKKLGFCFKLEGCYLTVASFVSAVLMFICGFFVTWQILNYLPLITFGVTMLLRTAAFALTERMAIKRQQ